MSGLQYIKGVRTRFSNKLLDEIQHGLEILNTDISDIFVEDCKQLCQRVVEAKLNINSYNEKLTMQSEKLAHAIDDSDEEFINTMIEEDSSVLEKACAVCHKLQIFEERLKEIEETDNKTIKGEQSVSPLAEVTEEMKKMFEAQMNLQKELVESKQLKKDTVKLPRIDIPSFNGNKLYWIEFWDSFESAVHTNDRLSDIDKFNYLKSKLTGEARNTIVGLSLSKKNYSVAIDTLHKRFGNRQETIDLHYKALMDMIPAKNSVESLRQFVDKAEKHLRCLEVLRQDTNQDVFVSMLRRKLPNDVLLQTEIMKGAGNKWSVINLRELLRQYIVAKEKAENIDIVKPRTWSKDSVNRTPTSTYGSKRFVKPITHGASSSSVLVTSEKQKNSKLASMKCRYCEKKHWSDECPNYTTIDDRKRRIRGSCYRCLKEGHISSQCRSSKSCIYCGEVNAHHRSLCQKKFKKEKISESVHLSEELVNSENSDSENVQGEIGLLSCDESVVMQTAKCNVMSPDSERGEEIRLILDSGSHRTYITENLAHRLGLHGEKEQQIQLVTFGSKREKVIKTKTTRLKVKLKNGSYTTLVANIVPNITGTITRKQVKLESPKRFTDLTKNLSLADAIPNKNETVTLDLLVGNDYYLDIIQSEKIEIQPGLYLLSSSLGWILSGRIRDQIVESNEVSMLILTYGDNATETNVFADVDRVLPTKPNLEDFWNIESIGITDSVDQSDDETAMAHFKETLQFENDRYQVTWPWREETSDLPENRSLAKGRLKSLVSRLEKQPKLLRRYDDVIKDQLEKGIIEKVERDVNDGLKHYIPHHVVITPEKSTTKLRIVYDASAKTRKEYRSLNECLYRGPVLLQDLCGILMRFRLHDIGIVADIEKAFLQIGLQKTERDVTRFLWLKDCENPVVDERCIQEYRFRRVPFGVISSPFLLGATIEYHLDTYYSEIANQLKENIYMDNVITGVHSVDEGVEMYKTAKSMFSEMNMNLREWMTNNEELQSVIPKEDKSIGDASKVLGHWWNVKNDTLALKGAKLMKEDVEVTKRNILKQIASVFDPLGLCSPVTLRGKLLLQRVWIKGYDWDDLLDKEDSEDWLDIKSDLEQIDQIEIQRNLYTTNDVKYSLACFSDASSKSYAAVIYLIQVKGSMFKSDLMFSKSRLAPIKGMSIPKLELMAVLIGVRCIKFVEKQLHLPLEHLLLFTDSQCVLQWLSSDKSLPVFIKNRVKEIKCHSDIEFRHVNSVDNAADVASRGRTLLNLLENQMWWQSSKMLPKLTSDLLENTLRNTSDQGCEFKEPEIEGLKHEVKSDVEVCCESTEELTGYTVESCVLAENNKAENTPFGIDINNYSSATRLMRVTAWCFRFIRKTKGHTYESHCLTSKELDEAEMIWLSQIQRNHFADVYQSIEDKRPNNLVKQLDLFVDELGLIRCSGRLEHAHLCEAARKPILLPRKDKLTTLLIEKIHRKILHSGVSQTLSETRHRFWIPRGRATIIAILKSCRICRGVEGGPYKLPPMAPMPKERVAEATPFSTVGLDYLGPLYIKEENVPKKVWLCLFTCLVTRAVHLEIVQDMTASAFLLCLRRFIAARGTPREIISDNAKQFKLSSQTVKLIWVNTSQETDVQNYVSGEGIKWTFIVELAPWMGGIYERLVGIVKRALRKTLGKKLLVMDQMNTVIKEIEAVINRRPLVYVGEDIKSSIALTPGHFLCLNPKTGIPSLDNDDNDPEFRPIESTAEKLLHIWKKGEKLLNKFWVLWRDEYLLSLRERFQNKIKSAKIQSHESPQIGDVVIIKDDLPRGQWKLGKLTELRTSRDGQVRSAQLQTSGGQILRRPLNLLYPIEVEESKSRDTDIQRCIEKDTSLPKDCVLKEQRPNRKAAEKARQKFQQM